MTIRVLRLSFSASIRSALGFSAYLLLVQVVVIGDVCDWCLAGDVMTTGLAGVVLVRLRSLSV